MTVIDTFFPGVVKRIIPAVASTNAVIAGKEKNLLLVFFSVFFDLIFKLTFLLFLYFKNLISWVSSIIKVSNNKQAVLHYILDSVLQ